MRGMQECIHVVEQSMLRSEAEGADKIHIKTFQCAITVRNNAGAIEAEDEVCFSPSFNHVELGDPKAPVVMHG